MWTICCCCCWWWCSHVLYSFVIYSGVYKCSKLKSIQENHRANKNRLDSFIALLVDAVFVVCKSESRRFHSTHELFVWTLDNGRKIARRRWRQRRLSTEHRIRHANIVLTWSKGSELNTTHHISRISKDYLCVFYSCIVSLSCVCVCVCECLFVHG